MYYYDIFYLKEYIRQDMFQEKGYDKYGIETSILDMKNYNGRINVLQEEDADAKFKYF